MTVSPVFTAGSWRFKNDNGSETGATWIANERTNVTLANNAKFRIRHVIAETAGQDIGAWLYFAFWSRVNGGPWYRADSASSSRPLLNVTSPYYSTGYTTTNQLDGTIVPTTFYRSLLMESPAWGGYDYLETNLSAQWMEI